MIVIPFSDEWVCDTLVGISDREYCRMVYHAQQ